MFVGYLYPDPAATPNEIFKDTMQRLRFDGVVDARPYQKWGPRKSSFSNVKVPGMEGVDPDTMHFVVWNRNQIKSATGNRGTYSKAHDDITKAEGGEVEDELEGWHGTPHEFAPTENNPLGEFDSSKIGTGEGNDAFGYGTYLAEAQGIGRHYKDQLSRRLGDDPSWWEGKKLPDALTTSEQKTYDILRGKLFKTTSGGPNLSAEESATLRSLGDKHRAYSEGIEAMRPKGFLYRVKLHPEIVNKMLDWDRPLGEQSEHVQKVFKDLMESEIWDADTRKLVEKVGIPHHQIKGSKLYELVASSDALAGKGQFGKAASEELARRGIPGIKYLDASSRRNGDGTRNFVVFPGEEKKVRIVERLNRGGMVEDSDKAIRRAMMIAKESK
jgi:hypothetical protein